MRSLTLSPLLILCGSLSCAAAGAAAADPPPRWNPPIEPLGSRNLVPNGSFECGPSGWSSLGANTAWGGDLAGLYGAIETGNAQDGKACLRLDLGPGRSPVTHFDVWPPARVLQSAPRVANLGWLHLEPGRTYTLSACLRSEPPGVPATLAFRFGNPPAAWARPLERVERVILTGQWQRYALSVVAETPDAYVAVGPDLSATPEAAATVWIDSIQVEEGETASAFQPREVVEIGLDTSHFGNLYLRAEPCAVTVYASSIADAVTSVPISVSLEDYFGRRWPGGSVDLRVPPHSAVAVRVPLAIPGTGHYRATFAWEARGARRTATLTLAVIEGYAGDDSPFGINHAPVTPELCQVLRKAGVVWARDWSANWEFVEPQQGQVSFAVPDEQIGRVLATGMRVLSVLPANPSTNWASEAPGTVAATGWRRLAYAPAEPRLLHGYIGQAVTRYRDRVRHWEFLNEPLWCPDFCLPGSAGYTVASYLALLQGAYAAMKAADPNCRVVGGLSAEAQMRLGDEFIRAGGLQYVDIYNLHPYPDPGTSPPEDLVPSLERIVALLDSQGGGKPIWATETGYYAADLKPWTPWAPTADNHAAGILLRDEKQAGDYTVRAAVILLAHGVEKIFYHQGIEGEVNNGAWNLDCPLLGPEGVPRKACVALAALAAALGPAPRYAAALAKAESVSGHSTAGVYGYAFQCERKAVLVAWAPEAAGQDWRLLLPAEATLRDTMGNPSAARPAPLGESPLYIESEALAAPALAAACALELAP